MDFQWQLSKEETHLARIDVLRPQLRQGCCREAPAVRAVKIGEFKNSDLTFNRTKGRPIQ